MSAEEILSTLSLDANEIPSASVSRSCSCHLSVKPSDEREESVQRPLQTTESQSSLFSELSAESDAPSEASATSLHSSVSVITRASFCNACSGRKPRTVHEFIESQIRLPTPPAAAASSTRFDFSNAKAETASRSSPSKGLCTPPCVSKSPSALSSLSSVPGLEGASVLSLCRVPVDVASVNVALRPRAASTVFRPRIAAVPRRSMLVIGGTGAAAHS